MRPYCDYDVVDEPLIGDGALETYRQLIIFEAEVAENATLEIMTGWIRRGGTVIIAATGTMQTVEGDPEPFLRLLGMGRGKYITGRAEDLSLAMHPAMTHLHAQDLAVIPSGWQKPDAAVKPLAMRGTTVVAWERAWGAGSVFALSDGASCLPVMLDFFHGIRTTGNCLAGAVDLCRSPREATAVFATHFEDGIALLNLNDTPVEVQIGSRPSTIPTLDLSWIPANRA